jgi:hypothetical protein
MIEGVRRRVAELADHRALEARWQFPASPLIVLELDGRPFATVDYSEASASSHWALRLRVAGREIAIALPSLAVWIPEELDDDVTLRVVALDHALAAGADRLGYSAESIEMSDG